MQVIETDSGFTESKRSWLEDYVGSWNFQKVWRTMLGTEARTETAPEVQEVSPWAPLCRGRCGWDTASWCSHGLPSHRCSSANHHNCYYKRILMTFHFPTVPTGVQAQGKSVQLSDLGFHARTMAARGPGGDRALPLPGYSQQAFP